MEQLNTILMDLVNLATTHGATGYITMGLITVAALFGIKLGVVNAQAKVKAALKR